MRYKKSQLFNLSLVIITIAVLTAALIMINRSNASFENQVGVRALNIFSTYQDMDKFLIYVDQAARYSAYNAISDVSYNGGFIADSECGRYAGYNQLNNDIRDCIPAYGNNLKKGVLDNLKRYLDIYPAEEKMFSSNFNIEFGKIDVEYDLLFYEKNLIGTTGDDIPINIYGKPAGGGVSSIIGRYIIIPSFNVDIGYDIKDYNGLISEVNDLVNECKARDNLAGCVKINKPDNWELREDLIDSSRTFAFDAVSDYEIIYYNESDSLAYLGPVVYRFALYFP